MLITEYRVVLPMTVEEYQVRSIMSPDPSFRSFTCWFTMQVGQLFSVVEASLNETGGGEGVEVLNNEPYENIPLLNGQFNKGQYTKKIYHLASKVPGIVKWIMPKGALEIYEEAWNAYPYCKTVLTNPGYMKGNALIKVETYHKADRGDSENVHELTPEQLKMRKVVKIDIANDAVPSGDYKANEDPAKFKVCMFKVRWDLFPSGKIESKSRTDVRQ